MATPVPLTEIGVGGIFALMVLREVLPALKSKNGVSKSSHGVLTREDRDALMRQVSDLHDWHSERDEDGRMKWYIPKSLERSIQELSKTIDGLTRILQKMSDDDVFERRRRE